MLTSSSSRPTRSSTTRPASEPVINAYETGPVAPGSHGYRQQTMEPLWSPAGAISGNRWQVGRPRKRRKQAKYGKEGVDGSSPSEGFAKVAAYRPLPFAIQTMNWMLDVHRTSTQRCNDRSIAA